LAFRRRDTISKSAADVVKFPLRHRSAKQQGSPSAKDTLASLTVKRVQARQSEVAAPRKQNVRKIEERLAKTAAARKSGQSPPLRQLSTALRQ
jgi:ribosomal protein S30